mmetsp:Transcript_2330/g.3637  ORF Transcript_2330/g.3637 Transcript_2330/m.3637 type:complete len:335 (-) Transcript_2330:341-1345(-)
MEMTGNVGGLGLPESLVPYTSLEDVAAQGIKKKLSDATDAYAHLGRTDPEAEKRREQEAIRKQRMMLLVSIAVAGTSLVSAGFAIYWLPNTISYIAFIWPFFTAPFAVKQRVKINKFLGTREYINLLRQEINRFMIQNDKLSRENDRLEVEVKRVQDVEEKLSAIAKVQGVQVSELVEMTKENRRVLQKMMKLLEAEFVQSVIQAVLAADTDQDFKISREECRFLFLRLNLISSIRISREAIDDMYNSLNSHRVGAVIEGAQKLFNMHITEKNAAEMARHMLKIPEKEAPKEEQKEEEVPEEEEKEVETRRGKSRSFNFRRTRSKSKKGLRKGR